jgi:hypothetical protein
MANMISHTHEIIERCVERMLAEVNEILQLNLGVEIGVDAKRILVCVSHLRRTLAKKYSFKVSVADPIALVLST